MNVERFKSALSVHCQRDLNHAMRLFEAYLDTLVRVNRTMNLTAITQAEDVYEKHFLDSAMIEPFIPTGARVADVGSGAGFPGLVLAIIRPDVQVTLIEPTGKRCVFLESTSQALGLTNVTVVNARAEDLRDERERFDVVTARAVANLSILMELCAPLVALNGRFIAMKGSKGVDEIHEARSAALKLHLTLISAQPIELPTAGQRINVVFEKTAPTDPQYPRPYGQIKKNPL
jgi:16S rRNA (guanine527-N7)-methyltransferase